MYEYYTDKPLLSGVDREKWPNTWWVLLKISFGRNYYNDVKFDYGKYTNSQSVHYPDNKDWGRYGVDYGPGTRFNSWFEWRDAKKNGTLLPTKEL